VGRTAHYGIIRRTQGRSIELTTSLCWQLEFVDGTAGDEVNVEEKDYRKNLIF
jgi:hypothetical protein